MTRVRVRYPEVDRMGIAHHSNHLIWFEIGRTELMRELGVPYSELEESGVFMPVIETGLRYRTAARYDEEIDVLTRLEEVRGARVRFGYRLTAHGAGRVIAEGFTVHAATDRNGSARRFPHELRDRLKAAVPGEGRRA